MTRFFTVLLVFLCILPAVAAPEIIAHRGASYEAPENTLPSFNLGWKQNTDACELDIYLTADRQIVVMHDAATTRTTGVNMKLRDSYLADLQELDAGKWKGPQWKGTRIPTLTEVLKSIPEGKRLFVEIKCGPEILPYLLPVFDASGKDPKQIVVISFYADVIRDLEKLRPQIKTYFLCSPKVANIDKLAREARVIGADGIDGQAAAGFDAAAIAKFRAQGLGVYVWTIDDIPTARKYADMGIDGITTDKPAYMRAALEQTAAK